MYSYVSPARQRYLIGAARQRYLKGPARQRYLMGVARQRYLALGRNRLSSMNRRYR